MNISKKFFKLFLFIVFLIVCFEISLRTRSYFQSFSYDQSSGVKILVYGDSIMGQLNSRSSILYHLRFFLKSNGISMIDKIEPALTTHKIKEMISQDIADYKPNIILIMAGKSDHKYSEYQQQISFFKALSVYFFLNRFITIEINKYSQVFLNQIKFFKKNSIDMNGNTRLLCQKENEYFDLKKCSALLRSLMGRKSREYNQVREILENILKQKNSLSEDQLFKVYLAFVYSKIGKSDKSNMLIKDINEKTLNSENNALEYYYKTLLDLKKYTKVSQDLEKLIKKNKFNIRLVRYKSFADFSLFGCRESIPMFELSFKQKEITRSQLYKLTNCYYNMGLEKRGYDLFKEHYSPSEHIEEVALALLRFFVSMGKIEDARLILDQYESRYKDSRDVYKAKLSFYNLQKNNNMLEKEFRSQSLMQSRKRLTSYKKYEQIAEISLAQKVTFVALQYPNERASLLKANIGHLPIHVFSTRETLLSELNSGRFKLHDLFAGDFEHLSTLGSCLVAHDISKYILSLLGKDGINILPKLICLENL